MPSLSDITPIQFATVTFLGAVSAWLLLRKKSKPITLKNTDTKYSLKLIKRIEISHDTRIFRFALPSKDHIFGLPCGKHVNISAKINGKLVVRSYTPVSSDDTDTGHVDLIIKVYFPNERFPEGGKMTQYLENMKIGDSIDFRGPGGLLEYKTNGILSIQKNKKDSNPKQISTKQIGLIAGGSGITPMLQIIRKVVREKSDETKIFLLFANQTEADILCREELEAAQKECPNQIKIHYTLDRAPKNWNYSSGFINEEMLKNHMPAAGLGNQILICGPPPMIKFACMPNLEKLGWNSDDIFIY